MHQRMSRLWVGFALLLLTPAVALAQASLSGTVRDTLGAVLPGVSVEASSPALIEKACTTVTDDTGQFRIVDLRPGDLQDRVRVEAASARSSAKASS